MREIVIELRGIARRQVIDYFLKKGARQRGDHFSHTDFTGEILAERSVPLGPFAITELSIALRGEESYIETLAEEFRRCFIRMGG